MAKILPFELQPTLKGKLVTLRPLRETDFDELHAVASDPLIWEQHPEPTRYQREVFKTFFDGGMQSGGAFAVVDLATGGMIGSSRYYGLDSEAKEVSIGFTFLARAYWEGGFNREMKALMLGHAFRFVETVRFHIGEKNLRSRRAIEKIGAKFVGIKMQGHIPVANYEIKKG